MRYGLLNFLWNHCYICVIYSDFNREEALNPVRLSETAVTSDDAENLPESEPELRGISLNQPIKQRFTTVFEKIQNLKLYFQPSKIEVSEEAQEKINGVIGVRLLNEDSQIGFQRCLFCAGNPNHRISGIEGSRVTEPLG